MGVEPKDVEKGVSLEENDGVSSGKDKRKGPVERTAEDALAYPEE